ncbi:hypothetical protein, partial [Ralstonia pseudosolanacearum]|uniref:hypothetical protein n=1 Tax=Ralstonia pseudosolanacearum TaxID=1310165 RepID=UPI001E355BD9
HHLLYGRLLFGKMSMSCRTSKKAAVLYPAYTGRIPLAPMESADSRLIFATDHDVQKTMQVW